MFKSFPLHTTIYPTYWMTISLENTQSGDYNIALANLNTISHHKDFENMDIFIRTAIQYNRLNALRIALDLSNVPDDLTLQERISYYRLFVEKNIKET